ncbi:GNAT family N-acetyltransferase [bacterium]|nr:GNAT family N-acetyltransferase [bacterium]
MNKTAKVLEIRPFERTDDEYEAVVRIATALWPDEAESVEEFRFDDENRDRKWMHERFIGRVGDKIVAVGAYGDLAWCHKPGKCFLSVDVDPEHQRLGHGSRMYEFLVERTTERDPVQFVTWTREDRPEYAKFITDRGYGFAMRYAVSRLAVSEFAFERWTPKVARVLEQGIKIHSVAELAEVDPDWRRSYYDLQWELFQDVPFTDAPTRESFEHFCKRFANKRFSMDAHWFARDGERCVGSSGLWLSSADPKKLSTGLTGVVRSHRRRGIASALKVKGIAWARDRGAKVVETDNEEKNPMFDLNLALGFKAAPAWVEYHLHLKPVGMTPEACGS